MTREEKNAYKRAWAAKNPDKVRAQKARQTSEQKRKHYERTRRYKREHRTYLNKCERERRARNREYYRMCARKDRRKSYWKDVEASRTHDREYARRTRPTRLVIERAWRERNKDLVRFYARIGAQKRKRRKGDGNFSRDDIEKLYDRQKGKCVYCRVSLKNGYCIDHIVPLSRGGSNWPLNLQLTCRPCNASKYNKPPEVFARERGFLI